MTISFDKEGFFWNQTKEIQLFMKSTDLNKFINYVQYFEEIEKKKESIKLHQTVLTQTDKTIETQEEIISKE